MADLLAHAVRRYVFKNILNRNDNKHTFSDAIITVLASGKFFEYNGRIIDYGVKKLP